MAQKTKKTKPILLLTQQEMAEIKFYTSRIKEDLDMMARRDEQAARGSKIGKLVEVLPKMISDYEQLRGW